MKPIPPTKICSECHEEKNIDLFRTRKVDSKLYYRKECKICWNKFKITRSPDGWKKKNERGAELTKLRRKRPDKFHLFILTDSKKSDRKKGLENDLDKEFKDWTGKVR